ncbi:hypothetical protein [Agromyces sp. NPDC058104]|uniref:hypothetical protein n=1 Tax=Agromyces sp. NPDC058104 TaxID=3346342 RepID=UPI0036D818ED
MSTQATAYKRGNDWHAEYAVSGVGNEASAARVVASLIAASAEHVGEWHEGDGLPEAKLVHRTSRDGTVTLYYVGKLRPRPLTSRSNPILADVRWRLDAPVGNRHGGPDVRRKARAGMARALLAYIDPEGMGSTPATPAEWREREHATKVLTKYVRVFDWAGELR